MSVVNERTQKTVVLGAVFVSYWEGTFIEPSTGLALGTRSAILEKGPDAGVTSGSSK